jgi:hypothetical protein
MELAFIFGGAVLLLFAIAIAQLRGKRSEAIASSILLTGYLTLVGTM